MSSTIINKTYLVERLNQLRLNDVAQLHQAVYGKPLSAKFINRKYDTAYTGISFTGFIAYDANLDPVAFYGVISCFLQIGDQRILAAQSADTMTHPDHRHKGLFVELANLTYALCRSLEIKVLFGFPNQNSLPGFINKLHWQVSSQMDCFTIPVKALPLERIAGKLGPVKKLYGFYCERILDNILLDKHGIANSMIDEGYAGTSRDDNYLNYKTYSKTFVIKIEGAEVWLKIKNGLIIGDIVGYHNNFEELMKGLKQLAGKLGLQQIRFQVSKFTRLHGLLKQYATPIPSFRVIVKDLDSGLPTDKLDFTFADIDIF